MARIVQVIFSQGYGGLEMVVQDFHRWLLIANLEAFVLVLEGSPIHLVLQKAGFANSIITISNKSHFSKTNYLTSLDSVDTAFLFHRQKNLNILALKKLKGKVSFLSHTFYKSNKRGFWHRFIFSKVDQWIALTSIQKLDLSEKCRVPFEKICIIPNGVDLKRFKPDTNIKDIKNEIHIAVVARLDPQKGHKLAIKALALLNKNYRKRIILHFYGGNTPGEPLIQRQLEILANSLNVKEQVRFEGFYEEIEKAMPHMNILWLTSHKETFGRCLIEAMASGVPIVASRAGGVPDIILDQVNGLLFESENPFDLVEKTTRLIEDPQMRENICENNFHIARKKYDQEVVTPELLRSILPAKV